MKKQTTIHYLNPDEVRSNQDKARKHLLQVQYQQAKAQYELLMAQTELARFTLIEKENEYLRETI